VRLPVVSDADSRDGTSNKDERLTNCLREAKKSGEMAVVRPGLVLDAQSSGIGKGLVSFNGELVSVYGSTLGIGIGEVDQGNLLYLPLDGSIDDEFGHVTTAAASGSFTSAQVVCGTESYVITAGADHVVVTPKVPNVLAVGANDFSIEGWIYLVSGTATLFRYTDGVDNLLEITAYKDAVDPQFDYVEVQFTDSVNDIGVTANSTSINGAWTHLAAVSEFAGDLTFYINGVSVGSVPAAAIDLFDVNTIQVGGGNAYFSNVRFYSGLAYTGNFSPSCYVLTNSIPALDTVTGDHFDFAQSPL
jgi:hypothetical protein